MSEQVRLNHSADDVDQMRKDWAESFHFDAPADLPGLLDDYDALHAEAKALRGLTPELPPRPPEGAGLPRYGLRWNGPAQPLSVPMDDGYWTPWHLAEALRAENARLRAVLAEQGERQEPFVWMRPDGDEFFELTSEGDYLSFPLYRAPQPGPDVRALVEALEKIEMRADAFIEDDRDMPIHSVEMVSEIAKRALATYHQDT